MWFVAMTAFSQTPEAMGAAELRLDALLPGGESTTSPTWAVEDFRAARATFGGRFERDLLPRLLGSSVERHYWVATFLAEDSYLRGDPPDLRLAVSVLEAALTHVADVPDPTERVHLETKVHYLAAVYAHALGDESRAMAHKAHFERLLVEAPWVAGASIPAVGPAQRAAFASIRGARP